MGELRVISGVARGRRLKSVPSDSTRPITDRVKEALFNIIGADIESATLLDLFAGTGCVGIEALSRGAQLARFVDKNEQAIKVIKENLVITGFSHKAEIRRMDAFTLLESPVDRQFDYVFIAPPQYQGLWKRALLSLDNHPAWLSPDAWIIVQIHPREYENLEPLHIVEFDLRKYGSTNLVFYRIL